MKLVLPTRIFRAGSLSGRGDHDGDVAGAVVVVVLAAVGRRRDGAVGRRNRGGHPLAGRVQSTGGLPLHGAERPRVHLHHPHPLHPRPQHALPRLDHVGEYSWQLLCTNFLSHQQHAISTWGVRGFFTFQIKAIFG